ncbi:MAG TPA: DUF4397 domain-containing protein [Cyclobacteriaceae bacterium]|nr:DUF4397 domain-containing protein [Cyclobacteriaceae bacterium]
MNSLVKRMKLFALVGGGLMMVLAGCKLDDNDSPELPPVAYVSLYNASPNSPGLSIMVDRKVINNNSFDYSDHTGYLRFLTGERMLEFGPYGANNVVADTTVKFEDGKAYSVFVVDNYDKADVLVLSDDTSEPASGKAKVRFLNLSPDAPDVDLAIAGTDSASDSAVFTSQSFKEKSEFIEVEAKNYDFKVKMASGSDVLLTVPNATFQDGWSYTILVRGFRTPPGGSNSVLSAEVIVD